MGVEETRLTEFREGARRSEALPPLPDDPDLVALRKLVFERELVLLEQLKARLDDPVLHARDVSEVVAEALLLRAGKDDKLARVLEPLVEGIFKHALRKSRFSFADALFPLMGPAIRRSIAETFRSMLESFNKSVEMSLSWKGLRWRMEGWRTGKPFSEIMLLHTLAYRVEQIFLIHSDSGLVLAHVVDDGVASKDADMVSAMLTAIQDFVRDCFAGGKEGELEQLQLGEFIILVEGSAQAYLACVVRGTPPVNFRQKLRSSLELILVDCADALADYDGNSTPFIAARRLLEDCLESRFVGDSKPLPVWVKVLPLALVIGLVVGAGLWVHSRRVAAQEIRAAEELERRRIADAREFREGIVAKLREEPGILVISAARRDGRPWELFCLRDELARGIDEVVTASGAGAGDFKVTELPFVSYEPEIVALRVKRALHPPQTVQMDLARNGTLTLSGAATLQWIYQAERAALAVPGVKDLDKSKLSDPRMEALLSMVREVEAAVVEFPLGRDQPVPADLPKLEKIVDTLRTLEQLASEMDVGVSLAVYGYADASGNDKRNFEISQARARTLAAMLYARGSELPITVYGMSAEYAQKFREALQGTLPGRRIELRLRLTPPEPDVLAGFER